MGKTSNVARAMRWARIGVGEGDAVIVADCKDDSVAELERVADCEDDSVAGVGLFVKVAEGVGDEDAAHTRADAYRPGPKGKVERERMRLFPLSPMRAVLSGRMMNATGDLSVADVASQRSSKGVHEPLRPTTVSMNPLKRLTNRIVCPL